MRVALILCTKVRSCGTVPSPLDTEAVIAAIETLGHEVEIIDPDDTVTHLASRLESLNADAILNLAPASCEHDSYRSITALIESTNQITLGSSSAALALLSDPHVRRLLLREESLRVSPWRLVTDPNELTSAHCLLALPNVVYPRDSYAPPLPVTRRDALAQAVTQCLAASPRGAIIEEMIEGRNLLIPYLGELLEPIEHTIPSPSTTNGAIDPQSLLDKALRTFQAAQLTKEERKAVFADAARALRALNIRDYGLVTIRLSYQGVTYIHDVQATLDLGTDSPLIASASLTWSKKSLSVEGLLQTILGKLLKQVASRRKTLPKQARPKRLMRVGVAFNLKSPHPEDLILDDSQAEFDSPATVQAILDAVADLGHEPIGIEANTDFAHKVSAEAVDVIFNIAEGIRGRNRESQVPSVLELLDIPYTGSDPSCLCLTLDKALAKSIVHQAGVPTPRWFLLSTGKERIPKDITYPLMVKPLAEGSSKGVGRASVVETELALRTIVSEMIRRYRQPALVEEFVGGREFTIGLIGEKIPRVLPVMEVLFTDSTVTNPIYGFEQKMADASGVSFQCPAELDASLKKTLAAQAKTAFRALGCRDVARIDFRMDQSGHAHFIECNPLPGLAPNFSDLAVIATHAGISYTELVGEILSPALRRARGKRTGKGRLKERRWTTSAEPVTSEST